MFEACFGTLRQSQGQSIVNCVYDLSLHELGTRALQKSGVATNRTNSAFNFVSSLGVSEITQIYQNLAITISYPTCASEIIFLLKAPPK